MLGTGQDGGECCGKAIGEVNPSTLGKTISLKYMVVVVVVADLKKPYALRPSSGVNKKLYKVRTI